MAYRVYTLAGLIPVPGAQTVMPNNYLGRQLATEPFSRQDIRYQNWAPVRAWAEAAANKVLVLARKPGKKIFLGHSEGAEVLCIVLRWNPDIDPDENVFAMTGNPERKYGGMLTAPDGVRPSWAKPAYGGIGFPADTPFRVWDVARQYDRFADFPNLNVAAALANNQDGGGFHLDYSGVRIGDPSNVKLVEGNVTYEMQPSYPAPSCRKPWWSPDRQALEDAKARPTIEKGYTRPFKVPAQRIIRGANAVGYDTTTRRAVRLQDAPIWNPFA